MTRSDRWDEIGERVFRLRCATYNLNVVVVAGTGGLLVVDTRSNHLEGRELRSDLRKLSHAPVQWVVNTHVHYDHTFGNVEFVPPRQQPGAELWAHRNAVASYPSYAKAAREELIEEGGSEAAAMENQAFAVPDHSFRDRAVIDLGDRCAELSYHGRGHTDGDIVVHIPDADVLAAGDLVRQIGPPSHWSDCFPLEWPATVANVLSLVGPDTVVVPGHGELVDRAFIHRQHGQLKEVADEVVRLFQENVPVGEAVVAGRWPYDSPRLASAVQRGYMALAAAEPI